MDWLGCLLHIRCCLEEIFTEAHCKMNEVKAADLVSCFGFVKALLSVNKMEFMVKRN